MKVVLSDIVATMLKFEVSGSFIAQASAFTWQACLMLERERTIPVLQMAKVQERSLQ